MPCLWVSCARNSFIVCVTAKTLAGRVQAVLTVATRSLTWSAFTCVRPSVYLMLVIMNDATATSAVEGFSAALNRMPLAVLKSMTYDQGREMTRHAEITQKTGVAIYFCDPHSPWQRGSNENINGLIRQYLPKGTDLSQHSQEELDEIAFR